MGLAKNEKRDTIRGKYIIRESTKRRAKKMALKSPIKIRLGEAITKVRNLF